MIDIVLDDPRWQGAGLEPLADRALSGVRDALDLPDGVEVALLGCDDARIAALNADFRAKSRPTNVLSWPATDLAPAEDGDAPRAPTPDPDGTLPLGDIAIAYDTCQREAVEQGKPLADHVAHLLVHGLLHLLGYDHIRSKDADRMEALEVKILGKLGIPDPY